MAIPTCESIGYKCEICSENEQEYKFHGHNLCSECVAAEVYINTLSCEKCGQNHMVLMDDDDMYCEYCDTAFPIDLDEVITKGQKLAQKRYLKSMNKLGHRAYVEGGEYWEETKKALEV